MRRGAVSDKQPWKRLANPTAPPSVLRAAGEVMTTRHWLPGRRAGYLQRSLATRMGVPPEWVIPTASCTAALHCAGRLLLGSAVVAPLLTYSATWSWALVEGRDLALIDPDEEGWPIEPVDIGVDLWGREFGGECKILDAAHRFTPKEHGQMLQEGQCLAVCYSFGPLKEVPWLRGGAVVSPSVTEEWWEFLNVGNRRDKTPAGPGIKGLIQDPEAAAVVAQLRTLRKRYAARQRVLEVYAEYFGDALLTKPGEASGHLAVLRFESEGHCLLVKGALDRLGVEWSVHYPVDHELARRIISVPCHDRLTRAGAHKVARLILSA